MIKNYFITALRTFWRNKAFTVINVLSLSVGISAALVIFVMVQYDLSFESFQKDKSRIYRVVSNTHSEASDFPNSGVPTPLPEAVQKEVAGLDASAAFLTNAASKTSIPSPGHTPAVYKDQKNIILADKNYFDLFPFYQWIAGSPASALQQPFQTVLTIEKAKLYFPGLQPSAILGKTVTYDDSVTCTVTGIVLPPKANTDFSFQEFISLTTGEHSSASRTLGYKWGFVNSASQFFIRLAPQTHPQQIEKQLAGIQTKYAPQRPGDPNVTTFALQPLLDIHFNHHYGAFQHRLANRSTLYGLLLVAAFLLALGCINFINLTTAQGGQRAKEVGVRKTMGSSRRQLIFQFLNEALLLTVLSTLFSLALTPWLLHMFSDFVPAGLKLDLLHQPNIQLFLLTLIVVVSGLAGFYPALILSGYRPILVLKNQVYTGGTSRRVWTRKTLTVFQFIIAQAFIMATLIVSRQIHYALSKDMGFRKDAIIMVTTPFFTTDKALKQQRLIATLRSVPGIERMAGAGMPPAMNGAISMDMTYNDGHKDIFADVEVKAGDSNYVNLFGLRLLAGRNIHPTDTLHELLINNTYAQLIGFKDPRDAIGKALRSDQTLYPIVGVVADFNHTSVRDKIKPLVIGSENGYLSYIHIALKPQTPGNNSWKTTIAAIGKAYAGVYPNNDFEYTFFDESIAEFYKNEQNISRLLAWATGLTIFISCLGLLGLVIYSTRQRTKEIGIRKVLGASVVQIVSILSKDFVKLVGLAFLVAMPLAWYATQKWLEQYAYRADTAWWLYPVSGLAMIGIALLTLSIKTIHAAGANPANSLRSE